MDQTVWLRGQQFDLMFIDMMTRHHQGAIDTAREELDRGQDTRAKELATAIITAQQQDRPGGHLAQGLGCFGRIGRWRSRDRRWPGSPPGRQWRSRQRGLGARATGRVLAQPVC